MSEKIRCSIQSYVVRYYSDKLNVCYQCYQGAQNTMLGMADVFSQKTKSGTNLSETMMDKILTKDEFKNRLLSIQGTLFLKYFYI